MVLINPFDAYSSYTAGKKLGEELFKPPTTPTTINPQTKTSSAAYTMPYQPPAIQQTPPQTNQPMSVAQPAPTVYTPPAVAKLASASQPIQPTAPPVSSDIITEGAGLGMLKSKYQVPTAQAPLPQQPQVPQQPQQPQVPQQPQAVEPGMSWEETMRTKYGIEKTVAPTLPQTQDTVQQYGLTPEAIQANLDQTLNSIRAKYDVLRREAETKTENERQSQLSGLYSLGEVNPMSSGTTSIGTASQDILNKRKDALSAMESEEAAAASARAHGEKVSAQQSARQRQLDLEAQIQNQYNLEKSTREENVNAISNALAMQSAGQKLDQTAIDNAWGGISNLLSTFGTSAFEGADATTLEQMEKAAKIPKGQLSKALESLKLKELTGEEPNIQKGADGALYSIELDDKGQYTARKLIGGKVASTGGGGGYGGTGATSGQYGSDLDAIVGNTLATIPTKFGQTTFQSQISKARNDADKISTVAAVALKNQPAEIRRDFINQTDAVNSIDKAISLIDSGTKSGVLQAGTQYVYNVFGKDYDPKLASINSYLTAAIQPYRNSVTGAAWGDQEDLEYVQLFGSTKYSPTELRERLVRIKEIMKGKSVSALNAYVNPMQTYENPFVMGDQTSTGGDEIDTFLNSI